LVGLILFTQLDRRIYQVKKAKSQGKGVQPEERLYSVMIGGVILPISLFW
jgi:hypothetical protein